MTQNELFCPYSCFIDHFLLVPDFRLVPCQYFFQNFPFFLRCCLGQLYDLTLNATDTVASVASHTRASTTLKNDTGVVGSVPVNLRATHAAEKKSTVGSKDTTSISIVRTIARF